MNNGMSTSPTMSLAEAADALKIHPHSLEKLIRAGEINAGKVGRAYVLMTRDVLAYVEKVIIQQTAARLNLKTTRGPSTNRRRAGSRSASASAGSCAQ